MVGVGTGGRKEVAGLEVDGAIDGVSLSGAKEGPDTEGMVDDPIVMLERGGLGLG